MQNFDLEIILFYHSTMRSKQIQTTTRVYDVTSHTTVRVSL
jgi:hypothetical protein